MSGYREMVFHLYNAATDAINCIDKEQANQILRDAQKAIAEMYPEPLTKVDNEKK